MVCSKKNFNGYIFCFLGHLFGGQLFWVICPWNEFEETEQCAIVQKKMIPYMKAKVVFIGKKQKQFFFWKKNQNGWLKKNTRFPAPPILNFCGHLEIYEVNKNRQNIIFVLCFVISFFVVYIVCSNSAFRQKITIFLWSQNPIIVLWGHFLQVLIFIVV